MKKTNANPPKTDFPNLRAQAKKLLAESLLTQEVSASLEDAKRLITELQIHQIELDLQNDELRKAQEMLASERERYADLYNFAPAAYFTFDHRDVIVDLNLMAADLLGGERKFLVNHPITPYITSESLQVFIAHRNKALETRADQTCELTIRRRDNTQAHVQARTVALKQLNPNAAQLWRTVMTDVTERKQEHEQLRKLSRVVEQSQVSVVITNTAGDIEYVNPKFCEITGYTCEEVIGQNPRILKSIGKTPSEYAELWRTILAGREWRGEFHNMKKSGESFWESTIISPIMNERGEITHFVAVKEDVTERKRAEERLRESEARYRRLVETAPGIVYAFSDKRGGIYYSPHVTETLGYPLEHLYEHPLLWKESIHPEDRERVIQALNEFIVNGTFDVEYRVRNARGEWRWLVDRLFSKRAEADETIIEGLAIDVTERKRAEQALQKSEQRYKSLFQNNRAVMLLINPETGQIVDANAAACAYYGYSHEQISALHIASINTLSVEQVTREMKRAQQEQRNHFFFQHRLASGEIRDVEAYSGPIEISDQKLLYSIVHDITERRRIEKELEESHAHVRAILNALPDLMFEIDRAGIIHDYHAPREDLLYISPQEFLGKNFKQLIPPDAARVVTKALKQAERRGVSFGAIYSLPIHDKKLWFEISIAAEGDAQSPDARFVILAHNITERKKNQDELKRANDDLQARLKEIKALHKQVREQAIRDPLTNLYNRRYLQETLEREVARARREKKSIGFIIMDIDHFKQVNDSYGHSIGDAALQALGKLIKESLRAEDIPCRYGGEEFTIIIPGASLQSTLEKANFILEMIRKLRVPEKPEVQISASFGVAVFPEHGANGEETLIRADRALYRAKAAGRNQVVIYQPSA